MGKILSFNPKANKDNLSSEVKADNSIRRYAQKFIDLVGPDPLVEAFIRAVDAREKLPVYLQSWTTLVNTIELAPEGSKGKLVIENIKVPCLPVTISSDIYPMDMVEFRKRALQGLSPKVFLRDYQDSPYHPLYAAAFFLDNPDYIYQGTKLSEHRVLFVGVHKPSKKTIKVAFRLGEMASLDQYCKNIVVQ